MAYSEHPSATSPDISLMDFNNFSGISEDNFRTPLGSIQRNHLQHSRSISSESDNAMKSSYLCASGNHVSKDKFFTPDFNPTWKDKDEYMHKDHRFEDEFDFRLIQDTPMSNKSNFSPGPFSDPYTSESSLSFSPMKFKFHEDHRNSIHHDSSDNNYFGHLKEERSTEDYNENLIDSHEQNSSVCKYSSESESETCFSLHEDALMSPPNVLSKTKKISIQNLPFDNSKNLPIPGLPRNPRKKYHALPKDELPIVDFYVEPSMKSYVDHVSGQPDDNVQVILRIRPLNMKEMRCKGGESCIRQVNGQSVIVSGAHDLHSFTFDHVAGEKVAQEDMFSIAGLSMVEHCLAGYNSTLLAYGQTGSGKTYTMTGATENFEFKKRAQRGIIPRIFEKLFAHINEQEESRKHEQLFFSCKCSFIEIYNEHITDLLDTSRTNLQVRSEPKLGQQIDGALEIEVQNIEDVYLLLKQGCSNRKIASTNLNKLSSRSHSVFSCNIQSTWVKDSVTNIRSSRLNLVDLAGSERQGNSGATGQRLKEASSINKSLHHLGHVIMILSESEKDKKERHIPYRDSKLTFLLQDSLGGNSKTTLIATVSSSTSCLKETLSTLRFAQRAKFMHNKAVINEDMTGEVEALKEQIKRLKEEVRILYSKSLMTSSISNSFKKSLQRSVSSNHYSQTDQIHPIAEPSSAINHEVVILQALLFASIHREKLSEKKIYELEENINLLHKRSVESETRLNLSQESNATTDEKMTTVKMGQVLEEIIPLLLGEKNRLLEEISKLKEEKRWCENPLTEIEDAIIVDDDAKSMECETFHMIPKKKFSLGCFTIFSRSHKSASRNL